MALSSLFTWLQVIGLAVLLKGVSPHFTRMVFEDPDRAFECPPGFDRYSDGSCAHASGHDMSWYDAVAYCEMRGSKLLEVHSKSEQDDMVLYLTSHFIHDVWLAGSDAKQEGKFEWQSKFPFNYRNAWNHNEPSNGTEEDCIEIQNENSYWWNDEPCYHTKRCEALCRTCRRSKPCLPNQDFGHDECCQCERFGFTKVPGTEVCVGQSTYSMFGEPEYVYDGDDKTLMHTDFEPKPWLGLHFPSTVHIVSVAFKLSRSEGASQTCTREHDIEVYTEGPNSNEQRLCGVYPGNKKGENCNGKMVLIHCAESLPSVFVKIQIGKETVKKCSQASFGEVCVDDEVYLGDGVNTLQIAELSFSSE